MKPNNTFKRSLRNKLRDMLWCVRNHLLTPFYRSFYCKGDLSRLHFSTGVVTNNTIFNVSSGEITIGQNTIFGHGCMVLTGVHEFRDGRRRKYLGQPDTPTSGLDVHIGEGCWIASGVIITGGVTIGDHCIVGAGAVVTRDLASGRKYAGVPARHLTDV